MRKDALRTLIENNRAVNMARKPVRALLGDPAPADRESTGNRVIACGHCGAPVVDSAFGRKAHAYRMPACKWAMEAAQS